MTNWDFTAELTMILAMLPLASASGADARSVRQSDVESRSPARESTGKFGQLGPLLSAIGEQAAADLGGDPEGIYIYAESGDGWYSVDVFREEGDVVRYYDASHALYHRVRDAWLTQDPEQRWVVLEYEIRGGKFDALFRYSDEVDVEDNEVDRRRIALARRYGEKRVVYPSWEERMKARE